MTSSSKDEFVQVTSLLPAQMEHQRRATKALAAFFTFELCGVGLALVICGETAVRGMASARLAQKDSRLA